jgi:hypothetical protein
VTVEAREEVTGQLSFLSSASELFFCILGNIDKKSLENLKALARAYNKLSDSEILKAITAGIFVEVKNETQI